MKSIEEEYLVARWNRDVLVGTPVEVLRDDGAVETRATETQAWVAAGPVAVVALSGIAGGYALRRCWARRSR